MIGLKSGLTEMECLCLAIDNWSKWEIDEQFDKQRCFMPYTTRLQSTVIGLQGMSAICEPVVLKSKCGLGRVCIVWTYSNILQSPILLKCTHSLY